MLLTAAEVRGGKGEGTGQGANQGDTSSRFDQLYNVYSFEEDTTIRR